MLRGARHRDVFLVDCGDRGPNAPGYVGVDKLLAVRDDDVGLRGPAVGALIVGAIVPLTSIIFLHVLTMTVFFHLFLRTFQLAILIVFAPSAIILYASDQTEKWVSLVFSPLFQQVVVLVILYVGQALFLSDGG